MQKLSKSSSCGSKGSKGSQGSERRAGAEHRSCKTVTLGASIVTNGVMGAYSSMAIVLYTSSLPENAHIGNFGSPHIRPAALATVA